MGLNLNELSLLADLKKSGAPFKKVVTLGRQFLMCDPNDVGRYLISQGFDAGGVEKLLKEDLTYVDPILRFLGAESVDAMDYSEYEGAKIVQDLNKPLPAEWNEQFDLIIDGGTIEHVFNVPEALRTLMSLCRVGGHVFLTNPANNQCGHGFYQFCPELMFRVFAEPNGFQIHKVLLCEILPRHGFTGLQMREVKDPAQLGYRQNLDAGLSMQLVTIAKRTAVRPIFETPPLQSDYDATWQEFAEGDKDAKRRYKGNDPTLTPKRRLIYALDSKFPRLMAVLRTMTNPLSSDEYYK